MQSAPITYISSVLDGTQSPSDAGDQSVALLRKAYPYFVPFMYIDARKSYAAAGFTPALLTSMKPWQCDWLQYCDFLEGKKPVVAELPAPEAPSAPEPVLAVPEPESVVLIEETITIAVEDGIVTTITEAEIVVEEQAEIVEEAGASDELITPVFSQDYFRHTGEKVPDELTFEPGELLEHKQEADSDPKSLMVMMSFAEWLRHFKHTAERQEEETREQKALKTMWQKEKLAAAMEEENEEIPENVFEMAVNSISKEEGMASETLADIYIKQGKYDHAIEMYRKLSLRNPQKNAYFAHKIEEALKNKQL